MTGRTSTPNREPGPDLFNTRFGIPQTAYKATRFPRFSGSCLRGVPRSGQMGTWLVM
jgi:hypothetical protein